MGTFGWLTVILLLAALPANAADNGGASRSGAFDAPLHTERVALTVPQTEGAAKGRLTCFYFDGVRVKQLDLGEVGAAELAILPLKTGAEAAPCRRETAAGEIVIPSEQWGGYFKAVRSGYVFFDAEDGTNGGLGFAVFDGSTGRKLFEDVAVGEIRTSAADGAAVTLRYRRALTADCSVRAQREKCWGRIAAQLTGTEQVRPPDCTSGYRKAKAEMARARCEAPPGRGKGCFAAEMKRLDQQHWNEAPSVIAYNVAVQIERSGHVMHATGGTMSCWPAD